MCYVGKRILYYCGLSMMDYHATVVNMVDDELLQVSVEGNEDAYRYISLGQIKKIYEKDDAPRMHENDD